MKEKVFLGIDLGAESGRVMAGHWDGSRMRTEELHRFANGTVNVAGSLRWDILRLWGEIQQGLTIAGRTHRDAIVSIGVDSWALDYVLLSKSDEMLGLPFSYRDVRTRGTMRQVFEKVSRERIFAESGLQFMEINTLYQWWAHHRRSPEVFAAAKTFLMIPDWLNWCLSGAKVAEFTNATTTQFFDPETRNWSRELLTDLGLPTGLLPEVVQPGQTVGTLRPNVTGRTGIPKVPVIAPATHDTGSAVAAVPSPGGGRVAYISSGTWSLVGIEREQPMLSREALECNITNEGGVCGTWRVLKNVMGLWLVQQCRRSFEAKGGTKDYGELVRQASASQALRSIVDPDDPRFLNPSDMPGAIQEFCRETYQRVPMTEGELIRTALDSLALKYAVVIRQLEELSGETLEAIHIVGGGSQNALLNQLTANACRRPVFAGPAEATVMGNLLMQALAAKELGSLGEIREVSRRSSTLTQYEPEPDDSGRWAAGRERLAGLLPRRI